jgi:hypothetical protein
MARFSNKQIQKILSSSSSASLDRKIALATEDFSARIKSTELILRDRTRMSKENALSICDYIISMRREVNPDSVTKNTLSSFCQSYQRLLGLKRSS